MNDRHDTPPPDTHPAPPPSDDDEPTNPGGHEPPAPPPNGAIDGAPEWAQRLDKKLDEVLSGQNALRANVEELLGTRRSELKRVTDLEVRMSEHEQAHAEVAYDGARKAVG